MKRGEIESIKEAMEQGVNEGCKTFDSALFDLLMVGKIEEREALKASDSPNNLRIQIDRYLKSAGSAVEPTLRLVKEPKLQAVKR